MQDISATKKKLTLEVPVDIIEQEFKAAFENIKQRTKLKGFREGKAPLSLIEKRYGKEVQGEVFDKLINKAYSDAIVEADLYPVSRPEFEGEVQLKRDAPLSVTITIEVKPKIEGLKYDGITVTKVPFEVTDEDVQSTILDLRERKAVYEPTEDELKDRDIAVIDIKGGDGIEVTGKLIRMGGADVYPEEFSKALMGAKKDDERKVSATFSEGYHIEQFAGKSLDLTLTVKETKRALLPDLDDAFARDLDLKDLAALKENIREEIHKGKESSAKKIQKAEVLGKIVESTETEVPDTMLENELMQAMQDAKASGTKEEMSKLRAELTPAAQRNVKAMLIIDAIGRKEKVTVSDEEMRKQIEEHAGKLGLSEENVVKYYMTRDGSLEGLRGAMAEDKVLDLILEKAVVEDAPKKKAPKTKDK